jgi:hypothetical protein
MGFNSAFKGLIRGSILNYLPQRWYLELRNSLKVCIISSLYFSVPFFEVFMNDWAAFLLFKQVYQHCHTTSMSHGLFSKATAQIIHNVGQRKFEAISQQNICLGTNCAILTMKKC